MKRWVVRRGPFGCNWLAVKDAKWPRCGKSKCFGTREKARAYAKQKNAEREGRG